MNISDHDKIRLGDNHNISFSLDDGIFFAESFPFRGDNNNCLSILLSSHKSQSESFSIKIKEVLLASTSNNTSIWVSKDPDLINQNTILVKHAMRFICPISPRMLTLA